MSAHIEVTGTASRTAAKFRYFVDKMNQVQNEYGDLKSIMEQIAISNDWASLGASLGVSEADAETIYNIYQSMGAEINGAFTGQLLSRCG